MKAWHVYLLRCKDGKLYTGITNNLEKRLEDHDSGKGAKFMRGRAPFELAFSEEVGDRSRASQLEWRVKQLRRAQKEELIEGRFPLQSLLENVG